ncbi:MAG: GTPase HflX [Candidatus Auribacterota bacterium]|jgi:GTP-binding protein HflX|nr:GTPase HflX [Candidatus Auribacterota bacterium]
MRKIHEIYDFSSKRIQKPKTIPTSFQKETKKVVLVALELSNHRRWQTLESLQELKLLAESAGFTVDKHIINKREVPSPSYCIGSGSVDSLHEYCKANDIHSVIFDDDLTPAQMKNISAKLDDVIVIDRTEIIIDIFAARARTKEGKLQIELARLEYMLPRLTRQWTHLVRQEGMTGGAVGVRGPGEKQLEMDRRQIRERIHSIKKELKLVETYRSTQRKRRKRHNIPVIALIGYTNSGKSTLLNKLTDSHVMVADKLFATLDPTARRFVLPNNQPILLIDTVGFINKLPHQLVDAFKATLEEVRQADLLIHVLDVSDDKAEDRLKVVTKVLKELSAHEKKVVTVLNKIDCLISQDGLLHLERETMPCVPISAKTGQNLERLFEVLSEQTRDYRTFGRLFIPYSHHSLIGKIYENGNIRKQKNCDTGVYLEAEYDRVLDGLLESFIVKKSV